jgi:hypothetical protein
MPVDCIRIALHLDEFSSVVVVAFIALDNVQSELFDMKLKYDEATSAK